MKPIDDLAFVRPVALIKKPLFHFLGSRLSFAKHPTAVTSAALVTPDAAAKRVVNWTTNPRSRLAAVKHRHLPLTGGFIVSQDIDSGVMPSEFEIPVVRRKPAVKHFHDLDSALPKVERPRGLLAPITGVTFDPNAHTLSSSRRRSTARPRHRPAVASANFGFPVCWISRAGNTFAELGQKPDRTISALDELAGWLQARQ